MKPVISADFWQASLAYFAKGPLSRARAAFHLDYDSTLEMGDLIRFLESLVLPINVFDGNDANKRVAILAPEFQGGDAGLSSIFPEERHD